MKKTNLFKKAGAFALSVMIALTMCSASSVFAAGVTGAASSDNTDYNTDRTTNSTAARQAHAPYTVWLKNNNAPELIGQDSGVVTLGKILNINQQNKFPNVEDFVYRVSPVSAWDNANEDTTKSGATIAKADMPTPSSGNGNSHHTAQTKGSGNDWYSLVTLGDFTKDYEGPTGTATEANTSSTDNSDASSNTDGTTEKYRRTRTTDLKFTFDKAGYYMYKVEEVGSIKNGTKITDATVQLRKDVAGVDYDNNTYYMVFYVANTQATENSTSPAPDEYGHGTKKGDTVGAQQGDTITGGAKAPAGGVYVHTITSWTNSQSTDKKAADLQDGQALDNAKDLMNAMDNNGEVAKSNTGKVDGNNTGVDGVPSGKDSAASNGSSGVAPNNTNPGPSTVTHNNLGKVGSSIPGIDPPHPDQAPNATTNSISEGPNTLEAYRMWNAQVSHDVVLKKNVTGNLGDRTKQFVFTVVLTGLENEQVYTTNVQAGSTDNTSTTSSATVKNVTDTGDVTTSNVVLYDAAAAGNETEICAIANDGKSFTSSTTGTAAFKVKLRDGEILVLNALPRSSSYQITEAASDHVPQYEIASTNQATAAQGNNAVITKAADKSITASNKTLATGLEFVDRYDGTVTVIFENNRDLATITGVAGLDYMVYVLIGAVLILAACSIIHRRKLYAEVDQ